VREFRVWWCVVETTVQCRCRKLHEYLPVVSSTVIDAGWRVLRLLSMVGCMCLWLLAVPVSEVDVLVV
jgi:uncharacterized membrane protein